MNRSSEPIEWQCILGESLVAYLGDEIEAFDDAVFSDSRRSLRLHPTRSPEELPFQVDRVPWFQAGYHLCDDQQRPGAWLQHAAADYYVQDAGSMLALRLCNAIPGQRICDLCAAPGGKSTGLLELLDGDGLLVANEVIGSRVATLQLALERSGFGNYVTMNQEVPQLAELAAGSFDCVLVDAPCSGQSMVARGKQSTAAFQATQIEHSRARQDRIIHSAAKLVRPGGRLVYSTCTYATLENELLIGDFLDASPAWTAVESPELEEYAVPGSPGCFRVWPHRHGCSGAFAAALIHGNDAVITEDSKHRRDRNTRWADVNLNRRTEPWLSHFAPQQPSVLRQRRDHVHLFPKIPPSWLDACYGSLPFARIKRERWEPNYGIARALPIQDPSLCVELSDEQAGQWVAGDVVTVNPGDTQAGWKLVRWRDRTLSWGKLSSRTLKNHFPKPLRQSTRIDAAG